MRFCYDIPKNEKHPSEGHGRKPASTLTAVVELEPHRPAGDPPQVDANLILVTTELP